MTTLYKISLVLVIVGALNWGMVGVFGLDLVASIFGDKTFLTNLVYTLVGICGLISTGILLIPLEKETLKK